MNISNESKRQLLLAYFCLFTLSFCYLLAKMGELFSVKSTLLNTIGFIGSIVLIVYYISIILKTIKK